MKAYFQEQKEGMLALLRELVDIESPSGDKMAVDRMGERVSELMQAAGASVQQFPRERVGDPVLGRWEGTKAGRQVLLLCHMDTVWTVGTLVERPIRVEYDRFYAPGAYDMKGGIVIALAALRGLNQMGLQPAAHVALLCNGDEEIGSLDSRALIEELAAESELVLCLEPSLPGRMLKTARKGVGWYTVRAKGRAAHAGADHKKGVNAIEEMAHQVLALQALTNYELGTTVSVGVISGGSVTNVIPAGCEVKVDFRAATHEEAHRVMDAIEGLRPHLPGVKLEIEGNLNRPPMVRDALMARTFKRAQRIAGRHGLSLAEGSTGGGSDANFTAAMGVPTLDGLGPEGDGAHATHEHVRIASLPEQATLLAALLSEW